MTPPAQSGTTDRRVRRWYRSAAMLRAGALIVVGATLSGCADAQSGGDDAARADALRAPEHLQDGSGARADGPDGSARETVDDVGQPPASDPASVGANELGAIPVIMYHRITEEGGSDYDNTTAEFREELQFLYDAGYRPVRVVDLVDGNIDIPAGTSPVVLTFDDSSPSQFRVDETGAPHPDTAVGILYAFAQQHPDFVPVATMYVLANPFGATGSSAARLLQELHALGFEVGNHTLGHGNLRDLGAAGAMHDLANGARHIEQALGVKPRTLALPYGVWPDDREIARSGVHDGYAYDHEGIVLVGAGPSPSPFSAGFEPRAIPRIRSQPTYDPDDEPDFGSGYWLWVLEQEPGRKYVSDGDPELISFPAEQAELLDPRFAGLANPY